MSSEEVLAYYPTVHKVADKLPLVQNKLEEIGLPSLSLTGPIAVYLHAFSGNDQPPAVIGAILSEVEFIRKFVPILYLGDETLLRGKDADAAVRKLEKDLFDEHHVVLHIGRDQTLLNSYTLSRSYAPKPPKSKPVPAPKPVRKSKYALDSDPDPEPEPVLLQYQVVEGIHLLVDLIRTYHNSLSGWTDRTVETVRQSTSIVFVLMLHCIHELILFNRPSLQYGFIRNTFSRRVLLNHDLRRLHSDARIQSAVKALDWFATADLFVEGQTCSITNVVESVYRTKHERDGNDHRTSTPHAEAGSFRNSLLASVKNFQAVIKELAPSVQSLDDHGSRQSQASSPFAPENRRRGQGKRALE